jgi:hypothetical protein
VTLSAAQLESVTSLAQRFRAAAELLRGRLGIAFRDFPRGSCGDAASLLGTLYIDNGLPAFQYTLGYLGQHSHAWLERDGLIVDVTADQFAGVSQAVIVTKDPSWHGRLKGKHEHVADFRICDMPELERAYDAITKAMGISR